MTDITANVVVSMPSQLFTMARSFKAVANGKIYIGKIDTDPVNPENQIQVYVENEDGSHVPVSQPIIINAAGYPVYNGQIAKFVTVQGHSMAVYDAYGAQQFYFPNVLKYDPDQLEQRLSSPDGASDIGVQPRGNLAQTILFVTPEQFGAIGDGIAHPLSERYATLAAAQAVYPFVTSLTQTIDWAACQAAENYAAGVCEVRCPLKEYHLGDDYLALDNDSRWIGTVNPGWVNKAVDIKSPKATRLIREGNTGAFGRNCIVRVKDGAETTSEDIHIRGVVFKGFYLSRNRNRRPNTKGEESIGFHANMGIKMELDVAIDGCEYGFFGYSPWGSFGTIRIDSCHKGIWIDSATATPEYTPISGLVTTSINFRVEIDHTPFGIVLRRVKYSKFHGFIEGALSSFTNYDITNETAIAMSTYNCDDVSFEKIGIEAWQGCINYNYQGTVDTSISWTQDYLPVGTSGKHGPYHAMSTLMSTTELYTLPATATALFYNLESGGLVLRNMSGDFSNTTNFAGIYFCTVDANAMFLLENVQVYFGGNIARLAPANLSRIITSGGLYIAQSMAPAGYTVVGDNLYVSTAWTGGAIGSDGRSTLTAPSGFKIVDFSAYVGTSATTQPSGVGIYSTSESTVVLQTSASPSYGIQYKLWVSRV
nr:phage head-binding domain-containing protein [Escherichia coli]